MISVWIKSVSTNEQNAAEHPYKTISNHGDFFIIFACLGHKGNDAANVILY